MTKSIIRLIIVIYYYHYIIFYYYVILITLYSLFYFYFQGRRGFYKRRRETTAKTRVPTEGMATVRIPGELTSRSGGGHHIRVRHIAVYRDILSGNVARV